MGGMFVSCEALTSLDLSNFDTSKVTDMHDMFSGCEALTSLDLSNFDTSKVTDMSGMFSDCEVLTLIKVTWCSTATKEALISQLEEDGLGTWVDDGTCLRPES